MIKKIILAIILFPVCNNLFAQSLFTKFVEKKDIQWAAIQTSNIRFKNTNLSLLLRKKLSTNSIKVALIDMPETFSKLEYITKKEILKYLYPGHGKMANISDDSLFSLIHFNNEAGEMVEIQQVFYVEKGMLKSVTTMASPKFMVVTSNGVELGIGNAFTTSFNKNRTLKRSLKTKAVFLGNAISVPENLSIQKQLYGQDLLKTIWPYLDKNYYEIIRLDSSRIIKKNDINMSLVNISVPSYSGSGTIDNALQQVTLLGSDSFSIAEIDQDWFYNEEKNIVFSNIRSILLSFSKRPVLKIVIK